MTQQQQPSGNLVTILRDGTRENIEEDTLSKDDVVLLQTGDIVPADLLLIEAQGLTIDEFDITGEILPVEKKAGRHDVPLFMGSKVLQGAGKGLVVATGDETELGKIMKQSWKREQPLVFPILRKKYVLLPLLLLPGFVFAYTVLENAVLIALAYVLLSAIFILLQNDDLFRYFFIRKELKTFQAHNLQIREPRIIERMRNIDTMCFDKTGVLTTRDLSVRQVCFTDQVVDANSLPDNAEVAHRLLLGSALCNDVFFYEKIHQANPVDQALILFAEQHGIDVQDLLSRVNRFYEKPFDSENRYMASGFGLDHGEIYYFIKGDPGVIFNMCRSYQTTSGEVYKLDHKFWHANHSYQEAISQNGDSAIALAYATGSADVPPAKYIFLCIFDLENALQPEAQNVVHTVQAAGMRSFLLTGDRAKTALKVGKDTGIAGDSNAFLTGRDIDKMGWSEVIRQSSYCSIFAKLIPSQKGVLIALLQQNGHSIAMIGDGPNDGIALKVADIGISFAKNSSPIARRLSNVLINDLADVQLLIEGSQRLQTTIKHVKALRISILAVVLLGFYVWALVMLAK